MTLPLVVGVDGSEPNGAAVDWAVDEAARHGVPLRFVYASLWVRYEAALPPTGSELTDERLLGRHILASAVERARLRDPEVPVTADIVAEDAAAALVSAGDHAYALVTGSRGRGELGELLLGSVGLAVAARARCPVVVVRGDPAAVGGTRGRILLGLGDPGTSAEAVRFAFREAEARGCVLDVVHAWRSPAHLAPGEGAGPEGPAHSPGRHAFAVLDEALGDASAAHPRVRTRRTAAEGPAGRILVDRSADADLVIVGARRRTGHFGLQLGRVSHRLLHHARCPVAIVPHRM
ncbi:universal stress protein [Streptomyces sp. NBC_00820]|uniref:universal stress protein n=1 Tax=Streptomyces sp. NBC_00820 TaxID=2975842 RepID=UPI002ED11763|nr:universal stress protein [Streptomyces sp. NBC_00820]